MNITSLFNVSNISSHAPVTTRTTVIAVVQSLIFLVLNTAAFVGNLLVCVAFYRSPSLRTVTNNFVFSLALTDLFMAVIVMPFFTVSSLLNRWIGGKVYSQILFCCPVAASGTSILTVMQLAINRYLRVVRPELYRKVYSKKTSALMSLASWVVAFLLAINYPAVGIRYENSESNPTIDHLIFSSKASFIYATITPGLLVGIPSLVVVICYVKIYKSIRQHNIAAAPSTQEGNSPYGVQEAKITRLLTVIVVCFYLCWFPVIISTTINNLKVLSSAVLKYFVFIRIFSVFASSVINPIIYGVMNQTFRSDRFLKIVYCR